MKIQYQFATDGPCFVNERPCFVNERPLDYPAPVGPLRDTWEEAAEDAVAAWLRQVGQRRTGARRGPRRPHQEFQGGGRTMTASYIRVGFQAICASSFLVAIGQVNGKHAIFFVSGAICALIVKYVEDKQ